MRERTRAAQTSCFRGPVQGWSDESGPLVKLAHCCLVFASDRGLAKTRLDRDYDAISDFGSAIKFQPREYYSYENRADANVKTRPWDRAIDDLTTAISLQVGPASLLMNVGQFRAIYPVPLCRYFGSDSCFPPLRRNVRWQPLAVLRRMVFKAGRDCACCAAPTA